MNILLFDMGSYTYNDILECLKQMGHSVSTVYYSFQNRIKDDFFEERFRKKIGERPIDAVFSVNFFPLVAKIAKESGIPYISWSYDSPLAPELEDYFEADTNYVYLFDRSEVSRYRQKGYSRVFHMPLAANVRRIQQLSFSSEASAKYTSDISFVGQLYEEPVLTTFMASMDEYSKGYVDALLQAQLNTYGADLLTGAIEEDLINRINKSRETLGLTNVLSARALTFAIQKQITFAERVTLLSTFGEHFKTKYYNTKNFDFGTNVEFMGPVKYLTEMPGVFRFGGLNLCPTVRCILSGIPLRALDIMASGGVLFSNYQPELAESFEDNVDVIMYGSLEEAFDKAAYYLEHDKEREKIAINGLEKTKKDFCYSDRLSRMLAML